MKHLGLICPEGHGHLNPMTMFGRKLQQRGYTVSVLGLPEVRAKVVARGLGFLPIGESASPGGRACPSRAALAELAGDEALRCMAERMVAADEFVLEEGPGALRAAGVDALLVDQTSGGGATVAQGLALPFVTVCNALALYPDPDVPPGSTPWGYDPTPAGRNRNLVGYVQLMRNLRGIPAFLNRRRALLGLPALGRGQTLDSPLAIVSQQPEFFDFPRKQLPPQFHYTGPFHDDEPERDVPFPFEKLDGRPLIYASLGTLQNRLAHVFHAVADACAGLPAQLVLSLGGGGLALPAGLPGSPLVVEYAPQRELIGRAALVITHAGLNTTLESLARGVPMVAVPVSHEQPGVAARIAHLGAGELVPLEEVSGGRLREAVLRVFTQEHYRLRAREAQHAIARADGLRRAADIVEQALTTGRPVLRLGPSQGAG